MTRETVSRRGGTQSVRAARRDEAALLGEVLADAFAEDPVFAWLCGPTRYPCATTCSFTASTASQSPGRGD